jgi:hypothetical protein
MMDTSPQIHTAGGLTSLYFDQFNEKQEWPASLPPLQALRGQLKLNGYGSRHTTERTRRRS